MIANWPFMAESELRSIRFNRCAAHIRHIAHTRQPCLLLMIHAFASIHILSVLSIFLLVVNCACKYLCKCIRMARSQKTKRFLCCCDEKNEIINALMDFVIDAARFRSLLYSPEAQLQRVQLFQNLNA